MSIYTHQTRRQFFEKMEVGNQKLAIGRFCNPITLEENTIDFAVLHLGDQNLISGAREFIGDEAGDTRRLKRL